MGYLDRELNLAAITARDLKSALHDGEEIALLDVREEGRFDQGHLLLAANLPLSRLEVELEARVPRRGVRIVLADDDGALAAEAAARLARFGYTNLHVLDGGVPAWVAAGGRLYRGVNVVSKAFGEFVEEEYGTPHIEATELKALQDRGADVVVLDSRPYPEYHAMSIPQGIDCPGVELVHRAQDAIPGPDTLVVVNCAGRTRSIIGAQSLINAGLPNRVVALKDGTMGWHLAGLPVATGATTRVQGDRAAATAVGAVVAAERIARRFGVQTIDEAGLARLAAERDAHTLFLFDVRSPEEYARGHRPGARLAPGGQLVQATDAYVAVRHARIVLTDDDAVRARVAASWLVQMGWREVYVLAGGLGSDRLETGPEPRVVLGWDSHAAPWIDADALSAWLEGDKVLLVDLQPSVAYRDGHIPGAAFAVRSRLAAALAAIERPRELVLTSPDGILAGLAAQDLVRAGVPNVKVLRGGNDHWRAQGRPYVAGPGRFLDTADDVWARPYNQGDNLEAAMRGYLAWETDLVRQLADEDDLAFVRAH